MTFEEALECEQKAKKRIGNLPKVIDSIKLKIKLN